MTTPEDTPKSPHPKDGGDGTAGPIITSNSAPSADTTPAATAAAADTTTTTAHAHSSSSSSIQPAVDSVKPNANESAVEVIDVNMEDSKDETNKASGGDVAPNSSTTEPIKAEEESMVTDEVLLDPTKQIAPTPTTVVAEESKEDAEDCSSDLLVAVNAVQQLKKVDAVTPDTAVAHEPLSTTILANNNQADLPTTNNHNNNNNNVTQPTVPLREVDPLVSKMRQEQAEEEQDASAAQEKEDKEKTVVTVKEAKETDVAAVKEAKEKNVAEEKEAKEKDAKEQNVANEQIAKEKREAEEGERKKQEAEEEARKKREAAELEAKQKQLEEARQRKEEALAKFTREENEQDRYDFPDFPLPQPITKKKKRRKTSDFKGNAITISIRSVSPETPKQEFSDGVVISGTATKNSVGDVPSTQIPDLTEFTSLGDVFSFVSNEERLEQMELELEDSLSFFQETHEEQDPAYIRYVQEREEQALKQQLAELEEQDMAGRKEIDATISSQSKEKQAVTSRNIEKYTLKAVSDEKREMTRLLGMYKDKMASNQGRVDQGIKILTQRHGQEMQKAMQQHQQHFGQQAQSPQAQQRWAAVAQQLQAKQHGQMAEFREKGEEMKKKSKRDFEVQQEKLRSQYQKKMTEIELSKRKVYAKIFSGFQQLHQRYLKRHLQRIQKRKEQLLQQAELSKKKAQGLQTIMAAAATSTPSKQSFGTDKDEKEELRAPSPIKALPDWVQDELHGEVTGASARHKQRKSVLSQVGKQLSVEIHNEGLWISIFADKSKQDEDRSNSARTNDQTKDKDDGSDNAQERFIPWGGEAHAVLQSIVCGEIPRGFRFVQDGPIDYGGALSVQGGHVRCVVTDLRTSDQTASSQRAASALEQEESNLKGLEQKIVELSALANEAEATLNRAGAEEQDAKTALQKTIQECEKAKKIQQEFRTKFSGYLGPDGNPLPTTNPNDRAELSKAIMRYKSNLDAVATRYKAAKSAMTEAQARTQKMKDVAKHAQKAVAVATAVFKKKQALKDPKKGRGGRLSEAAEIEKASIRVKDVIASFHRTAEKRREQLHQKRNSSASSTWVQSLPGLPGPLKKSLWHKMHRRRQQIVLRPSMESLAADLREDVTESLKKAHAGKKTRLNIEEELIKAEQEFCLAMHPEAPKDLPSGVPPSSGSSAEPWAEPGWLLRLDVPEQNRSGQILPCAPSFPVFNSNLAELCSAPGRQSAAFSRTSQLRCLASNLSAVATATSLAETNPSVSSGVTLTQGDPLNISENAMEVGYTFHVHPSTKQSTVQKRKPSAGAKVGSDIVSKRQDSQGSAPSKSNQSPNSQAQQARTKKRRVSKITSPSPAPQAKKPAPTVRPSATTPQPAAIARTPSAQYGRQPTPPNAASPAAAAAAAQYNHYMNQGPSAHAPSQQQANFQRMQQPPPQQQQQPPQRAPGQYGSPQQRQMAQLQMMQRQQQQQHQQSSQQHRSQPISGYPQPSPRGPAPAVPPQPFFNPMAPAPGRQYQQPPQHMQMQGMPGMQPMGQPMHMAPPTQHQPTPQQQSPPQQRQPQQQHQQHPNQNSHQGGTDDSRNDPLFMLNNNNN